jgi:hypothetical protein
MPRTDQIAHFHRLASIKEVKVVGGSIGDVHQAATRWCSPDGLHRLAPHVTLAPPRFSFPTGLTRRLLNALEESLIKNA